MNKGLFYFDVMPEEELETMWVKRLPWRYRKVCTCQCHWDGRTILHWMNCCTMAYRKYITPEGVFDVSRYKKERTSALRYRYPKGNLLWIRFKLWYKRSRKIRKFGSKRWFFFGPRCMKLPIVRSALPKLAVKDLCSVQPVTNTVLEGIDDT